MSVSRVFTRATVGIEAPLVEVEAHLSNGLPSFSIVGLPEAAVKESKERVRSALINSGFEFPRRRITVNLAPADLPKEGGRFDLPIALAILIASQQIPLTQCDAELAGELALDGALRPIRGVLPMAIQTEKMKRALIIPLDNADEASLVSKLAIFACTTLLEVIHHLSKQTPLESYISNRTPPKSSSDLDLADVIGQYQAKRALIIAAAGSHHMLMSGPPGTGKTMLASRLTTLLPPLREEEMIEMLAIHSLVQSKLSFTRPFRQPHHTASGVALVGGGKNPKPGEISLAHQGVLFLDELPEFDRKVLEVIREPIESGEIHIARAMRQVTFPARFQLITAMNPCPCGYWGDNQKSCQCTPEQIQRYQGKISGPFLDRIDIHVQVTRLAHRELFKSTESQLNSSTAQEMVVSARERQYDRQGKLNAHLSSKELHALQKLPEKEIQWLAETIEKLALSPRAYHRVLKVAGTIADLDGCTVQREHLLEALSFRPQTLPHASQQRQSLLGKQVLNG